MFTLNAQLREHIKNNPIVASVVMLVSVGLRDPNEISIDEYEKIVGESRRQALTTLPPERSLFPDTEIGETMYQDILAQYFINERAFSMEHPPITGNTFGEMLNCWRDRMLLDETIAACTRNLSATSLDFEARNIALATHRVK